jgi:hypothetical protein
MINSNPLAPKTPGRAFFYFSFMRPPSIFMRISAWLPTISTGEAGMKKLSRYIKRIVTGLPLVSIIGASFFPLQNLGRQFLVLFALVWFMAFMLFDIFAH